jgi:hypothetical protein
MEDPQIPNADRIPGATSIPGANGPAPAAPEASSPAPKPARKAPKRRTASSSPTAQTGGSESDYAGSGYPSYEETARRAYELYLQRGGGHGRDHEDWYQAERELREAQKGGRAASAPSGPKPRGRKKSGGQS